MSIPLCTITGNVQNLLGTGVGNVVLNITAPVPFVHSSIYIVGPVATVSTDDSGGFSVAVIETATVGQRLNFMFQYSDGTSAVKTKTYYLVVPNETTVDITDLITANSSPISANTFPASSVTVIPSGNLTATDVQSALVELQGEIDVVDADYLSKQLATSKIFVGNGGGIATARNLVAGAGITIANTGSGDVTLTASEFSSGDLVETAFSIANNQSAAANVTGFSFANGTVRSFYALVSLYLNASTPKYQEWVLQGIQKAASWNMSQETTGDSSGVVFTITNAGQIQYTSPNSSGFVAGTLKFKAITTSV